MQYGFILPGGDIHTLIELAIDAEAAGWDGVFYWGSGSTQNASPFQVVTMKKETQAYMMHKI